MIPGGRWPALERWFAAMERRPAYAAWAAAFSEHGGELAESSEFVEGDFEQVMIGRRLEERGADQAPLVLIS